MGYACGSSRVDIQVKHALGWSEYQVRSDRAMRDGTDNSSAALFPSVGITTLMPLLKNQMQKISTETSLENTAEKKP